MSGFDPDISFIIIAVISVLVLALALLIWRPV
jgi:hypothetical protein